MANKIMWGFLAVLAVSFIAFMGISYAYRGDATVNGPNYNADVHEQLEAAIESGNYDSWLQIRQDNNLPTRGRMFQVINKDNFDKYAELHKANLAGDIETANSIKAELGLGQGMMKRGNAKGLGHQGSGSNGGKMMGSGNAQKVMQNNFVDADKNGVCDYS